MQKHAFKKWLILPVLALLVFGLTQLAYLFPAAIEYIYSRGIYILIAATVSRISALVPFSLDDAFYVLLVLVFLSLIFLAVFKKITFAKAGKTALNIIAAVYIFFYGLWGFNYFRQEIHTRLGIENGKPEAERFEAELRKLVENTNKSWVSFDKWDKNKTATQIETSYKNLASALKIKYPAGKRRAKNITAGHFFAQAGISGYYGPFFNEVHVNSNILPVEYPFILAHEKAHQFGITNEAEANFYAWLVCSKSKSKQLQYSANLHVLQYFLFQGYKLDVYPEIIAKLDKRVKNDLQTIREHWMSMRNEKIDEAASKVNDFYLKTNKIKKGIEEYSGVVKLVIDYEYDKNYQKKYKLGVR